MLLVDKPEILAPVGGPEQLIAAVRSGADAVYLGTKGFNARQNAKNFDYADLKEAVSYCHARDVKVHVTVNTLVQNPEIKDVIKEIEGVAASGADAVIIQDLGVMRLFKEICPDIDRHASTQMAIHNADGAKAAEDLGFSRVVLARELSLREIEDIAAKVNISLETFIHGAHCMSLSGACYMSALIGERSGNRGRCAQPCRTDVICGGRNYALSLKDMSYLSHINDLHKAGVCSFKIEGRMKRPEYVAAAVTACRKALAGEEYDIQQLESVFSRSGFTDGYLTGRRDISMFGRRTEEDEARTKEVLGSIAELYRGERQSVPLEVDVSIKGNDPIKALFSDGKNSVEVLAGIPEKAISKPADESYILKQLSKTGGTPFYIKSLNCDIEDGLAVLASVLNSLRRDALEQLLEIRSRTIPYTVKEFDIPEIREKSTYSESLWARFEKKEQIPEDTSSLEKIILPILEIDNDLIVKYKDIIAAELPTALFPEYEKNVFEKLGELCKYGLSEIYCENIYGAALAKRYGLKLIGGPYLNVMNSVSVEEYKNIGFDKIAVSFELSLKRAQSLASIEGVGMVAYGKLPMMTVRACPAKGKKGCGICNGAPVLKDRKGVEFQMLCRNRMYGTILNSVPLYLADKDISGFDFKLLYFTTEDKSRCADIINDYIYGSSTPVGGFTRGLYFRNIK